MSQKADAWLRRERAHAAANRHGHTITRITSKYARVILAPCLPTLCVEQLHASCQKLNLWGNARIWGGAWPEYVTSRTHATRNNKSRKPA